MPIERSTSFAEARAAGGNGGTLRDSSDQETSPNSEPKTRRAIESSSTKRTRLRASPTMNQLSAPSRGSSKRRAGSARATSTRVPGPTLGMRTGTPGTMSTNKSP